MWLYDVTANEPHYPTPTAYGDLLNDAASVDTLARWCTSKNIQEIYFSPIKFPGCDPAADSLSAAGWKRLITKLDSAKVNAQIMIGDGPGATPDQVAVGGGRRASVMSARHGAQKPV